MALGTEDASTPVASADAGNGEEGKREKRESLIDLNMEAVREEADDLELQEPGQENAPTGVSNRFCHVLAV
jgi:hypothetical protein